MHWPEERLLEFLQDQVNLPVGNYVKTLLILLGGIMNRLNDYQLSQN